MKRNDYICLFLSIIINIGIVFALTVFSTDEMVETDEIKIGLVAVESDASTRFKGEKNVDEMCIRDSPNGAPKALLTA